MSHQVGHAAVPLTDPTPRQLAQAINLATDGKLNSIGEVTLTENVTTTIILDKRMGVDSVLLLFPTSANAVAIIASVYVSFKGKETATITHTSDANTDKTFDYIIIG
jgi:hypothetical protein